MRKIIFSFVFLLIAGVVFAQEFTFRGLPWGSTVEQIIAKEGKPDSNTDGLLIYQNKIIAGYNAMLSFSCSPPRSDIYSKKIGLMAAKYAISVTKADAESVYFDLLNKLSALYGKSTFGSKPNIAFLDRDNYWIVSKTKITITLIYDFNIGNSKKGTFVFVSYDSPDWFTNEFGDL